ncbi:hypothetical protein DSECCO2_71600 [anaerobic digester metagenome]
MTYYDPASGLSVIVLPGSLGNPDSITYYPSIINDSTAAAEALLAEESAKSFMQTQWRLAASNMVGIGVIASGWA